MANTPDSRYENLLTRVSTWVEKATANHWLAPGALNDLAELQDKSPSDLFDEGSHRPLVVGFFGGTGVGKSTLLNRLAGAPVALTGIERPTSREVSIYVHASVQIAQLPGALPIDNVRMARHEESEARQIMWVDMPDIDSVESHHRDIVMSWLPHIDVVIYVVSPERYRDDRGWQLLRDHAGVHAWLFVINQWDRGQDVQFEDFKQLLGDAGFVEPIVLRTDSRSLSESSPDEFGELRATLGNIANRHVMSQLEAHSEQIRLEALDSKLQKLLDGLGNSQGYASLEAFWRNVWQQALKDLIGGLEWAMRSTVHLMTGRELAPLKRSTESDEGSKHLKPLDAKQLIWDEWAQSRTSDALGQLLIAAGDQGLPVRPLKGALAEWPDTVGHAASATGQLRMRQSLAEPGNALQRWTVQIAWLLSIVLPLAAVGWASYQVVKGYYDSAMHHLDYLGTDFAIHSVLLIALAWFAPWFVYTRLKPSLEGSALKGLRRGIRESLSVSGEDVVSKLKTLEGGRRQCNDEGVALQLRLRQRMNAFGSASPTENRILGRMLAQESELPRVR